MAGDAAPHIGVVCGLISEASLLSDQPVQVRAVAGKPERAAEEVRALVRDGASGIISFGLAGGLSADFRAGDLLIAERVTSADRQRGDIPIDGRLKRALARTLPLAKNAVLVGSDTPALTVTDKARLARDHGAAAVDMESHAAGRAARDLGVPFAVLRAIADPAERAIPPLAMAALHADGTTSAWPVVKGLIWRPWFLPAMLRLSGDSKKAHRALARAIAAGAIEAALRVLIDENGDGPDGAPGPSTN